MRMLKLVFAAASLVIACGLSHSKANLLAEADIEQRGEYSLSGSKVKVLISVYASKDKRLEKGIGNINGLQKIKITLNGKTVHIAEKCRRNILDVRYIRLEGSNSGFRFWMQGGDGSESYQVQYIFSGPHDLSCRFLPEAGEHSIVPMIGKKNLKANRKK